MRFNREDFIADAKNYWAELDESQRRARQWAAAAVVVTLLAVPAWFLGRPLWQRWQRDQALEQVVTFAQKNDYRSATLALRRAVELAPNDPATWQEAVRLLGTIGSPEVLQAREQLARLAPEEVALKLSLVGEALRFDRIELAETTLASVAEASRRDEAFFRLAAALALELGREDELEANLEKLVAAAPEDAMAKFSLAALRLWSAAEAKQRGARVSLEAMTAEPKVRVRAALELLKDATRQHDERRTTVVMALLLRRFAPEVPADFPSVSRAAWTTLLEKLKAAAAAAGAGEPAALARWLADVGQPREALLWLESLPAADAVANRPGVADIAAQLSAELGDLDRTENYLRAGAWGAWPREALTLAVAARLQRLRHSDAHARASWEDAVAAAGASAAGLRALVRLAEAWREPEGIEVALQAATAQLPNNRWAFDALEAIYAARRDLPKLWAVYDAKVKQRPADDRLAAKWLTLGCILNKLGPEALARAETLRPVGPTDEAPTLALAAVRWRQGRSRETLALLGRLSPERQVDPATTYWRLLAEADLGNKSFVRGALATTWRAGLSAEEVALLRAAAVKLKLELPAN